MTRTAHSALLTGGITYENRSGGTLSGAVLPATAHALHGGAEHAPLRFRRQRAMADRQPLCGDGALFGNGTAASPSIRRGRSKKTGTNLLFGEVSVKGSSGRNTWVAGAAAQRDAYRPRDVPRFAYTYAVPGLFVQDDFNIAPWLSVSASARADFHNQYGVFLSPRVSALLRWAGLTTPALGGAGILRADAADRGNGGRGAVAAAPSRLRSPPSAAAALRSI